MPSATKKLKTDHQNPFSSHQTKQPSTELPHDLVFMRILPRLSYKILSRFKCVSKSWYEIISNDTKFTQDQSLCASPLSRGAVFSQCYYHKTEFLNVFGSPIGINSRQPLLTDPNLLPVRILASSGGLLCILFQHDKSSSHSLCICNLAMEEGHFISAYGLDEWYNVGLAFDPSIEPNCCKMVYCFCYFNRTKLQFEYRFKVYSSDTCVWVRSNKVINTGTSELRHDKPVTLRNVVYWDCYEYAISFDPWNNIANYIELPEHETSGCHHELGTRNGCITYTGIDNKYMEVYFFYESEKKWERKYRVDVDVVIDANQDVFKGFWHMMKTRSGRTFEKLRLVYNVYPVPYHGGDKLFFRIHDRKTKLVLSYDLKSGKAEKFFQFRLRSLYERWMKGWDQRVFTYHNSMVKLPGFVKSWNRRSSKK